MLNSLIESHCIQGSDCSSGQNLQNSHISLETHIRQDRRGLGLPGGPGHDHGGAELHHGHHDRHVRPRQALAGGGPPGQHLPAVPGLGQSARTLDIIQRRVCSSRGASSHWFRDS